MAIIDYDDITSMRFATLNLPAKALIPVLATISDKETGLVPSRLSKLGYIAGLTGISIRATQDALQELHDTNRISLTRVHGHPATIIYQPTAQFSSRAGEAGPASLERHVMPHQDLLNFATDTLTDSEKARTATSLLLNSSENSKTTTDALPVEKSLIKAMIDKHGSSVVVEIISAMEEIQKEDPANIKSPGAYFRACCEKNWVPTMKTIQEKKLVRESREKARAAQDAADADQAKRRQMIKAQRNDPEVMKRIKASQLSFTGGQAFTERQSHDSHLEA